MASIGQGIIGIINFAIFSAVIINKLSPTEQQK
jgi:hypothetical protein